MIRPEVSELVKLGRFPSEDKAGPEIIKQQEVLLLGLNASSPASNDEVHALVQLFNSNGEDTYYGLAWTLLHLIEKSPGWPLEDCLADDSNGWIAFLKLRLENGRRVAEGSDGRI